jgi:hypothetical protein
VALPPLPTVLHSRSDGSPGTPHPTTTLTAGGMSVPFLCRLV